VSDTVCGFSMTTSAQLVSSREQCVKWCSACTVYTAAGHTNEGVHAIAVPVDLDCNSAAGWPFCAVNAIQLQAGPLVQLMLLATTWNCAVCWLVCCRVVPGQWLGPWVLCKALAAAAVAAAASPLQQGSQGQQQPHQLHHGLGLHVHVACDPGGGAPQLDPQQLRQLLPADSSSNSSSRQGVAAVSSPRQQQQQQPPHETQQPQQPQGLLLLVPLTLGVGKVGPQSAATLVACLLLGELCN